MKYLFEPSTAIAPQGKYVVTITHTGVPESYDAIIAGTQFLYFFGQFRYHDVYNPSVVHLTAFCLMYGKQVKEMQFCQRGNDMN